MIPSNPSLKHIFSSEAKRKKLEIVDVDESESTFSGRVKFNGKYIQAVPSASLVQEFILSDTPGELLQRHEILEINRQAKSKNLNVRCVKPYLLEGISKETYEFRELGKLYESQMLS